jgi:hypothetical protein
MRLGLVPCAALLCALPAHGDTPLASPPIPQAVLTALMTIDEPPSRAALDAALASPAIDGLVALAITPAQDRAGRAIRLRAIRALPLYCPAAPLSCGAGTVVHDRLIGLIDSLRSVPTESLLLRAAVEALGVTRSGLPSDVDKLTPLLGNASRDVRATVVRALINVCNSQAIDPLLSHYSSEPSDQVKHEIAAAIDDLSRQCSE